MMAMPLQTLILYLANETSKLILKTYKIGKLIVLIQSTILESLNPTLF